MNKVLDSLGRLILCQQYNTIHIEGTHDHLLLCVLVAHWSILALARVWNVLDGCRFGRIGMTGPNCTSLSFNYLWLVVTRYGRYHKMIGSHSDVERVGHEPRVLMPKEPGTYDEGSYQR